jgi:hypothetical protein
MKNSKPQLPRIYVFRGTESARAAIQDLMDAGIPPEWLRIVGGSGRSDTTAAGMRALGIAEPDARSLTDRIERGGIVVAIPSHAAFSQEVEAILRRCQAAQERETATDEQDRATSLPPLPRHPISGGA